MAEPQAFNKQNVRVGGSSFTLLYFSGQPIGFAQEVAHQSAAPVGPGAVPIHPMDEPYPIQVITPAAAGMGTITLNLYELYYSKVWERLGAQSPGNTSYNSSGTGGTFANLNDLVDVFIQQASMNPDDLYIQKLIRPPALGGEARPAPYWETFHRCVITDIKDGENINIGTMEVIKQITIAYTRVSRQGISSKALELRNAAITGRTSPGATF